MNFNIMEIVKPAVAELIDKEPKEALVSLRKLVLAVISRAACTLPTLTLYRSLVNAESSVVAVTATVLIPDVAQEREALAPLVFTPSPQSK